MFREVALNLDWFLLIAQKRFLKKEKFQHVSWPPLLSAHLCDLRHRKEIADRQVKTR